MSAIQGARAAATAAREGSRDDRLPAAKGPWTKLDFAPPPLEPKGLLCSADSPVPFAHARGYGKARRLIASNDTLSKEEVQRAINNNDDPATESDKADRISGLGFAGCVVARGGKRRL